MRKACSMLLVTALLVVSSAPLVSAGMSVDTPMAGDCPFCHVHMASMGHAKHAMTPAMRHCRIECCGHHDNGGLPHLLAPHTLAPASGLMPSLAVIEPASLALWTAPFAATPPSPPPKSPFSELS